MTSQKTCGHSMKHSRGLHSIGSELRVCARTGLAGVRGQVGLLSGGYSSCVEFIEAAPGLGTVLGVPG